MVEIVPSDLLVMWTTTLLYVMWKTHSFKSNIMLSVLVSTLFTISVLHRLYGEIGCLYLMMVVVTIFVWIEIPKITRYNRRRHDKRN